MIIDLRSGALPPKLMTEFCVIGAGAAGVTLALELEKQGRSVVLLESGGLREEFDNDLLSKGSSIGHPMAPEYGRHRVLGGATTHWSGRCAKLDAIDFESRSWVKYSGWPISHDELSRYYDKAIPYCGFDQGWRDDDARALGLDAQSAPFETGLVEPFLWRYAPLGSVRRVRNWGRDFQAKLSDASIRVVVGANLTDFVTEGDGAHVKAIIARSLQGQQLEVEARNFILCCGGLENARLLLHGEANKQIKPVSRMTGRFFMQHPRGKIGRLKPSASANLALQDRFNVLVRRSGVQYELGFALPAALQQREHLLNASVFLSYTPEPETAWEHLKLALKSKHVEAVRNGLQAMKAPAEIVGNLYRRALHGRHPLLRDAEVSAIIDLEQAPDPQSRVSLSADTDALGMRRVEVDWRIGDMERRTGQRFAALLGSAFSNAGLGAFIPEPWVVDESAPIHEALAGTFHHIATTRMASDPQDGVVDANCKVHGLANLYVQGCSVFATGGHANPTLTIVALAIRQAEILARNSTQSAAASAGSADALTLH